MFKKKEKKNEKKTGIDKLMENYWRITVSGAFSKLFKYTLLSNLNFKQSSQQFKFTTGLSSVMAGLLASEAKDKSQHFGYGWPSSSNSGLSKSV